MLCVTQKKILSVYLKKVPYSQHLSSGQGWSESPQGLNNLPWRLARRRERTTERKKKVVKNVGMNKQLREMKKERRGGVGGGLSLII